MMVQSDESASWMRNSRFTVALFHNVFHRFCEELITAIWDVT